eukprot:g2389.t1
MITVYFEKLTSAHHLKEAFAIESSSYPADEAASLGALKMRMEKANEHFEGLFLNQGQPNSNSHWASGSLIGFVCGTCTNAEKLEEESMAEHHPNGRTLCIHSVVIHSDFRRRGLATILLRKYIGNARLQNLDNVRLITKPHLLHFYEKAANFKFVREWEGTHGQEKWMEMILDLRTVPQFQVDAFSLPNEDFSGNPACVCSLPQQRCKNADDSKNKKGIIFPKPSWSINVASANNLSETAFVKINSSPENSGDLQSLTYDLTWFTPTTEVALCGHATLATAHTLWHHDIAVRDRFAYFPRATPFPVLEDKNQMTAPPSILHFLTPRSGLLKARRRQTDGAITLDFPSDPVQFLSPNSIEYKEIFTKLVNSEIVDNVYEKGEQDNETDDRRDSLPIICKGKFDILVELPYHRSSTLKFFSRKKSPLVHPDYSELQKLSTRGVIVTTAKCSPHFRDTTARNDGNCTKKARLNDESQQDALSWSTDVDFISRWFGPQVGVKEDPVTGSAHCTLASYWSGPLGKNKMIAEQMSARGGRLEVQLSDDKTRVELSGFASTFIEGLLSVTPKY